MVEAFNWSASESADGPEAARRYEEQSEALALALLVNRHAVLLLSAFSEHHSDHDRIAACRRAFRSAGHHVEGVKVRTVLIRDRAGVPAAVLGYLDASPSEHELREALDQLGF